MTAKDIPELLQSSALAPLFLNLDNPEVEEKEEGIIVDLKLKPVLPGDDPGRLLLVSHEGGLSLRIPAIAEAKEDMQCVGRVGHVNYMVRIGRMYWDPDDGEIGVDWALGKDSAENLSPESAEYIIACLVQIYSRESLYFLAMKLKGNVPDAAAKPIIDQAKKELEDTFEPAIESAMGD